jgi:hypothetical protein
MVLSVANKRLGTRCQPLVCLNGFPDYAVEFLLLGLGFCGAKIKVHTDHDAGGSKISRMLFHRTIDYDNWCPNLAREEKLEEQCLPYILDELAT